MRCPSVRSSVFLSRSRTVKTNKYILELFSPSCSRTILVFPYRTSLQYSDEHPPPSNGGGVECRWGRQKSRSRPISGSIACCVRLEGQVQYTQVRRTIVAGKRRILLMAGDDKEVYDKKHQRYAEDNGALEQYLIVRNGKSKA